MLNITDWWLISAPMDLILPLLHGHPDKRFNIAI